MFASIRHKLNVWKSVRREKKKEKTRSPKWQGVRDSFMEKHPRCAACDSSERLQCHHVKPFHLHPELELEESNLISLCMSPDECHLIFGHSGNFECFNPHVREQAARAKADPKHWANLKLEAIKSRQK